ncbi:hypothetical protein [Agromyces sp. LHK192]|uniref:hypothetical protein n=1 Tax=Agromyces sp. LHK192 TaxID=2498704 RepID=UPI000FD7C268|nr:hypothetical protein [Agromyces sp. LHK192]
MNAIAHRPGRRAVRAAASAALALGLGLALAGVGALGAAAPASAVGTGTVAISVVGDPARVGVADTAAPTRVTLQGSGFQSIEGGFGGMYVLFGWVAGPGWEPSAGGESGSTYRYVADDPNAPAGYQLFVPFPGSSTAAEGNGGTIAADGTWTAELTIAGPTFTPVDAAGAGGSGEVVDCREVQCGIVTIGAHGVVNPSNETFTPIAFEDFSAAATPEAPEPTADADTAAADAADADADATTAPTAAASSTAGDGGAAWVPWAIVAGVVVIGAGTTVLVVRRRRAAAVEAGAAATEAPTPRD